MKYYHASGEAVLHALGSGQNGLTQQEADARLARDGRNRLGGERHVSLLTRFILQLANPMVLVLLGAAAVSGITAALSNEPFTDVWIILAVVLLNSVLGVVQESKAEAAIQALRRMTAETTRVIRGGKTVQIPSEELVVGDIILLEAGDAIPADARLLEAVALRAEEAALTGESLPADKSAAALPGEGDVAPADCTNMVYMGASAVYGRGRAVVTATGMQTEMGRIADALTHAAAGETPLQKKLAGLSRVLTWLVLGICVFMFLFTVLTTGFDRTNIISAFMLAVSLAVAAIPEGLAAVVTVVLSLGVTRMSRRCAIVRRLTAVETLGCTQVICSDKTGTLTQNKMTVVEVSADDRMRLAASLALCTDAVWNADGSAEGDPTQCAAVRYAASLGLPKPVLEADAPRIGEIPFDSERKLMTTVHRSGGRIIQHTTGAPDVVLGRCTACFRGGKIVPLTPELTEYYLKENSRLAGKALRVIAAAFRELDAPPGSYADAAAVERDCVFLGLAGMIDPVRPEVPAAIAECRSAGIRPVMITGDHRDTAAAIAMQLGIIHSPAEAMTGAELDAMDDETLIRNIARYGVYARVRPEHKVRIVNAWRASGHVTAMTGDGVNDAPSVKSADIGIGMGMTGTDVTKNVADMILADDNFATIVAAVGEGRRVYDNICKAIQFLLSSNLSEVLSIFTATVMGFTILEPVHILWINLITDSLPALALGMEPAEPGLMRRAPRGTGEGIFSHGVGLSILFQGVFVTLLTMASYLIGQYMESGVFAVCESPDGVSMAFMTMAMAEIFHSINMRSQFGSIFRLKRQNIYLLGAAVLSLLLTSAVIYVPGLSAVFGFEPLSLAEYLIALGLAACMIPLVELTKAWTRARRKRRKR